MFDFIFKRRQNIYFFYIWIFFILNYVYWQYNEKQLYDLLYFGYKKVKVIVELILFFNKLGNVKYFLIWGCNVYYKVVLIQEGVVKVNDFIIL